MNSEQSIDIPIVLINNAGFDIYELYASENNNDNWGENIVPDGYYFANGSTISDLYITINRNNSEWDFKAVDQWENEVEFYGLDLGANSSQCIGIEFTFDSNTNSYMVYSYSE